MSGASPVEICRWLQDEHGITYSDKTLRKRLQKTEEMRSKAAVKVVREEMARTLLPATKMIQTWQAWTYQKWQDAAKEGRHRDALTFMREGAKLIELSFRYGGLQPDEGAAEGTREDLERAVRAAFERVRPGLPEGEPVVKALQVPAEPGEQD